MDPVYLFLDPYLIWFYRLTGHTALDFLLGTFVVALLAVIVGEGTSSVAALLVKRQTGRVSDEAKKYQDLSMEALKAGDRPAYEASNKLANEAFGKSFFMQLTLSATFFWPVFFVLGWMQTRFSEVEFPLPLVGLRFSYVGAFVPLYIAAYLLFKAVKKRVLPVGRGQAPHPQGASAPGAEKPELS
jgi:hypothetical protein